MAEIRELDIREPFSSLWRGRDVFACAASLSGKVYRSVKNRRTLRFEEDGKGYFIKIHGPTSRWELLKNLFQLKMPVFGAENEYRAIRKLETLGVSTMTVRAYASRGSKPCSLESFLVTDEITGHMSLEDFCRSWAQEPPASELKHKLIRALAETCAKMHFAGVNHRDCYLCHFLLKLDTANAPMPVLYVIDLHRAQIRKKVPLRYLVKDIAGLFFSAMDTGITRHDILRFIRIYANRPLREELKQRNRFYRNAEHAARKLYIKEFRKNPPL